jgi:acyl dehydratase
VASVCLGAEHDHSVEIDHGIRRLEAHDGVEALMRIFDGVGELRASAGESIGSSGWLTVDQERIDTFAAATGDHQWIHVEPHRAASGPFGTTIVPGFLALSLIPVFSPQVYAVKNISMAINYGLDKARFITPVPVDSRIRGSFRLLQVSDVSGGVQVRSQVTIELAGSERPACVAETLVRYLSHRGAHREH